MNQTGTTFPDVDLTETFIGTCVFLDMKNDLFYFVFTKIVVYVCVCIHRIKFIQVI